MTSIVAVGFGPYPGQPANPGQEIIDTLRAERWTPDHASLSCVVAPTSWWRGVDTVLAVARKERPEAILLIGHAAGASMLQVARAAQNAAGVAPDRSGLRWPGREIAPGCPERLPATLPPRTLARVIGAGGAPAEEVADGGDFVWNRAFYAALAARAAPRIGLLLAPTAIETARRLGLEGPAALNRAVLLAGVQSALRYVASACVAGPPLEPA